MVAGVAALIALIAGVCVAFLHPLPPAGDPLLAVAVVESLLLLGVATSLVGAYRGRIRLAGAGAADTTVAVALRRAGRGER